MTWNGQLETPSSLVFEKIYESESRDLALAMALKGLDRVLKKRGDAD
jgi:hypothetical protein